MSRIKILELVWNEYNVEHIKKHNVTVAEAEEVVKNFIAHKAGKKGRYIVIGRIGTRLISVIVNRQRTGIYYPVTARDAAKEERKRVYEKEKI